MFLSRLVKLNTNVKVSEMLSSEKSLRVGLYMDNSFSSGLITSFKVVYKKADGLVFMFVGLYENIFSEI